ncbi:MAG: hypothetical protein EUB_00659 [Eubacterium sp.]|uniref:LytR/AlgR family response regulator transcription factor n=1 Tax=Eubacterium sp. TaxID=142586 RepID=UPI0030328D8E
MYRIAICDDDENFLNQLSRQTETILCEKGLITGSDFEIDCFSEAGRIQEKVLKEPARYQLLLLDVELSDENGMALARIFRKHEVTCSIIFITSYRDYVFDCFDTQPLWYLLKPVDFEKFKEILLSDYRRSYADTRLVVKINGRKIIIPFQEIYALEATEHRTRIWMSDGFRDWNGALSALKPQLPLFEFCQSHNSYVINLAHVKEIQRTEVLMDNDRIFPVSRRYYDKIFEKYFTFLKI